MIAPNMNGMRHQVTVTVGLVHDDAKMIWRYSCWIRKACTLLFNKPKLRYRP